MKRIITLAAGILLAGCQQSPDTGNPEHAQFTQSDLELLHIASKCATSAEVYSRIETPRAGEERIKRYPISQGEFEVLRGILSQVRQAPHSTQKALSSRWKSAGVEIRLLTVDGSTLCAISDNTISSYSDSLAYGNTLLCLPDTEMALLDSLPTLKAAKEYKKKEDDYALDCRRRAEAPGEIREAASRATSARVRLTTDDDEEFIKLTESELTQLKHILATTEALPPMTREAWDTPESHCMPLPPQQVYIELQLLILKEVVILSIPMNYQYLAPKSQAELFTQGEGQGQRAAMPDDVLTTFVTMPLWARVREEAQDMVD